MPQQFIFDAKELQGDTHVTPYQAPVAPAPSTLASDLASTGKQFVIDHQGQALQQDLNDEASAYIAAQSPPTEREEDALSEEEGALVSEAEKKVARLRAGYRQGKLSSTAFKARTETIMKEYINQTPGLSMEFRRVASSALGFDPNGAALKNAMDAADLVDKNDQAMEIYLAKRIAEDNRWVRGKSIQWNIANSLSAMQRDKIALENQENLQKTKKWEQEDRKYSQERVIRETTSSRLRNTVSEVAKRMGGFDLSDQTLRDLSVKDKTILQQNLEDYRVQLKGEIQGTYSELDGTTRDNAISASLAYIDNHLSWLNGERTTTQLKNHNDGIIERSTAGFLEDKATADLFAVMRNWPSGVALPNALLGTINTIYKPILDNIANAAVSTPDAILEALLKEGATKAEAQQGAESYLDALLSGFDDAVGGETITPEQTQAYAHELQVMSDAGWNPDPDTLQTYVADKLFKAAAADNFDKVLEGVNPKLMNNIRRATAVHVPKVFQSISAELSSETGKKGWYDMSANKDGKVWFAMSPVAEKWYAEKLAKSNPDTHGLRLHRLETEEKLQRLNDKYGRRLSNVVKATARIGGVKDYVAVAAATFGSYLDYIPFSTAFRNEVLKRQAEVDNQE